MMAPTTRKRLPGTPTRKTPTKTSDTGAVVDQSPPIILASLEKLRVLVSNLFHASGLPEAAARIVADALVEADHEGIPSHGVMLVPMYLERIRAGSISLHTEGRVVSDTGSTVVLDAMHALGQLTAHQAVLLLAKRAAEYGIASVAVRNAFHFGTAGRWAKALADRGCIGIVMSNTRPLMPAPGGAERIVGNNPVAIAMPTADPVPVVLDMALSASAMGKIRMADSAGKPIPEGWATDSRGVATTDPAEAIKGMLLPAAGPKGFGLAFMVDLICGGLSSGAIGDAVKPLYGDASVPYGCAHFFLAIDVARFRPISEFADQVSKFARRVRDSTPAHGVTQIFSPGEIAWRTAQKNAEFCPIETDVAKNLQALAAALGVPSDNLFAPS
jgi:LDH2 family malate/lactate/ureidoglycolate dehydrogenase